MNPLVHGLPNTVTVDGEPVTINTEHTVGIRFEALIGSAYDDRTKFDAALALYFPTVPRNREGAMEALLWFYRCGKRPEESDGRRAYDFSLDHDLIHASLWKEYGVDIYSTTLHWWAFRSLLFGLSEDSPFMKAVGYRLMTIPAKMDREQREFYAKMKRIYALDPVETKTMTIEDIYRAKFGVEYPLP